MKKTIKLMVGLLITIILVNGFSACSNEVSPEISNAESSTEDPHTVQTTTAQSTTEEIRLSDSCHKVMASGYDKNNNFYELVANETEDYSGANIQMGVIKNNKWLIKMNSDFPFIDENGNLKNNKYSNCSIYDDNVEFYYVGNGCFYYDDYIYNSNKNKCFSTHKDVGDGKYQREYTIIIREDITVDENQGKILLQSWDGEKLSVFNTDTMKITKIQGNWSDNVVLPYSCGLFGYIHDSYSPSNSKDGFYNLDGKKVIDLSKYNIEHNGLLIFSDNKCTFEIRNDIGTLYEITIDTKGKIINQVAK